MKNQMIIRTYSELITLPTFEERFKYLSIGGKVSSETFGSNRYLNQIFYKSNIWREIKDKVIIRDLGRDLGLEGFEIYGTIIVHHMNPILVDDIHNNSEFLLNPEYLICTSLNTHNAIHYSDESSLMSLPVIRKPNDTCPWRK